MSVHCMEADGVRCRRRSDLVQVFGEVASVCMRAVLVFGREARDLGALHVEIDA